MSLGKIKRPTIVCICGSTRFIDTWNYHRKRLTEAGEIVLAIEVVTTQAPTEDPQLVDPELKLRLDELHKRKIDLADYVFVLNVGGYIGESTRSEIEYARAHRKPVKYLQPLSRDSESVRVLQEMLAQGRSSDPTWPIANNVYAGELVMALEYALEVIARSQEGARHG